MTLHGGPDGKLILIDHRYLPGDIDISLRLVHELGHSQPEGCTYDVGSEAAFIRSWKHDEARAIFFQAGEYQKIAANLERALGEPAEIETYDNFFSAQGLFGAIYVRHRSDPNAGVREIVAYIDRYLPETSAALVEAAKQAYQAYQRAVRR